MSDNTKNNSINTIEKHFSEIFKKGIIYSSVSIFQQLLNFLLIPLYTFFLSPNDFGIIAVMTTTAGIILAFTKTPLAYGFVRFYYSPEFINQKKSLYFNSLINVIIRALIPSLILFFFANEISLFILGGNYKLVIILYSVIIFFQPLEDMSQDLLKIQKRAGLLAIIQTTNLIFSSLLIITLLFLNNGLYSLIYGLVFSTIYPVLTILPIIIKNIEFKLDIKILKPVYKYGNPLILLVLSQFIINNIDFYIINMFLNLKDVGLYSFASKFGALLGAFLIFPIRNIFEPIIFNLEDNKIQQRELLIQFSKVFFIISLFIYSILSIFSKELVHLFASSEEFYPSWILIPFISFAYICFGMMDYFGKGLEIEKKTNIMSSLYLIGAVINIILNLILVQYFELYGVVLSKIFSFLTILLLCSHFSKKHFGISFPLIQFSILAGIIIIYNILIIFVGDIFNLLISKISFFIIFSLFLFIIFKKWFPINLKEIFKQKVVL